MKIIGLLVVIISAILLGVDIGARFPPLKSPTWHWVVEAGMVVVGCLIILRGKN